ncbi:N-methylhydantoinase [Gottschalkia acidurici 9a]|uniref:N-methylhydantoinase n=1 Tax=Gottschalkia acidurici (strain ATCC 7906 / DSM 604 / BCRC 14475 / CIP 104303 / KCTC 5404 / NCIMB 10678 / 9a) TaxID=1128398 RepID=K0B060_GOTA9|nr:hydantoinase/oxoprolinase family protein [Gottschalkia acidurici]AFS78036.1 N-methylhydantoinase [Gottschalkia acidurici 9a]
MIIGLDVGGTNIDAVIIYNKEIINKVKKPLYNNDLLQSILETLDELLLDHDKSKIERVNLSTTVCTNAIVKNEISSVGMFIQSGPGLLVDFLACGQENKFLKGSIDHRGRLVKDLDMEEIEEGINLFKKNNIEACGVVTKFSTRNPSLETEIKDITDRYFRFTTTGHSMSGKLNFPRRVYTTYLNSAVHKTFNDFSNKIIESLRKQNINAPVYILKADGGTMDIKYAEKKPVETILSGPAASFMGISALLPTDVDSIFLDIGGTTTDIFFLADGVPLFEPLGIKIDKYNTLVRSIYSVSIGLGGDSSINAEDGKLKIGPKKEAIPYSLGGNNPTPTDAMIYLGLINDGDKHKAKDIMNNLGSELAISGEDTARLILDTMADIIKSKVDELLEEINSKPVYTVKEVLYGRKIEPKLINIIGGPAKSLVGVLEKRFNIPCNYPENYHIANAVGAALAGTTKDITILADTERKTLSIPELDIYKQINTKYNLKLAKKQAVELLKNSVELSDGTSENMSDKDIEITEESSFNMIEGYYKTGENIRVQAQIKPGLIYRLRSENKND